ncbi:MAG: molybdopterin molybdenumtransferase [Methylothermaceae bacteria B42]|nr:MAG: molybdopterin molybdenumtransferase [Methylothermaceae bacteria B42]HHJ38427.1 molybdopterin molybdenumtransferase MoeA [Methylothermaceae bacterium]
MIYPSASCADLFEPGLLSLDKAVSSVLDQIIPISETEYLSIQDALHRVLALSPISNINVPSHTNSAVDGYAIHHQDIPPENKTKILTIAGEALAGKPYIGKLQPGQAIRIMTGASLPEGSGAVLMQEQVKVLNNDQILIDGKHRSGENIRLAGEDIQKGEAIIPAGKLLLPADLGLIASVGQSEVCVTRKIRVGIISTGNEILPQGAFLEPGKIYDSNRFSLIGALGHLPVQIHDYGIIPDDPEQLKQTFLEAAQRCDAVISSGGVSVGEADYAKLVLAELGDINFWKVAIKPGRPMAFGKIGDSVFFGLPGNPVAVMVTFYVFVLPALHKLAGITEQFHLPTFPARTIEKLRKKPGRTEFQRGIMNRTENGQWQVKCTGKQGSGILKSMSQANCFIVLEHDRGNVEAGEWVEILPFACLP